MLSTWSVRVAPAMTELTLGLASSHAKASSSALRPPVGGECLQALEQVEVLVAEHAPVALGQPGALRGALPAPVLAGEEAAGEWEVGQYADVVLPAEGHQLRLYGALHHAVVRLHADKRRKAVGPGRPYGLADLPGHEVRASDVADLALPHHVVQRLHRLLYGRVLVGEVDLVQVHVVGPQAAEALFELGHEVEAGRSLVVRAVSHAHGGLGGDEGVRPLTVQREPYVLLGAPLAAVGVGGVDQVDAHFQRAVDYRRRAVRVHAPPEVVGAKPYLRYLQPGVSKSSVFQAICPLSGCILGNTPPGGPIWSSGDAHLCGPASSGGPWTAPTFRRGASRPGASAPRAGRAPATP